MKTTDALYNIAIDIIIAYNCYYYVVLTGQRLYKYKYLFSRTFCDCRCPSAFAWLVFFGSFYYSVALLVMRWSIFREDRILNLAPSVFFRFSVSGQSLRKARTGRRQPVQQVKPHAHRSDKSKYTLLFIYYY